MTFPSAVLVYPPTPTPTPATPSAPRLKLVFRALPSADATCTVVRASETSRVVCASLNFTPPPTAPSTGFFFPISPPTAPPTPPAFGSLTCTSAVITKSAAFIWPRPMFASDCISPERASSRSCLTFCMPMPRSTTTKHFEFCAIMRSSAAGEPS